MDESQLSQRLPGCPPQEAAKRILLLDCDDRRREIRAEALASRGAVVDCAAGTVVARMLWKPGSHDLVLIDLRGAEAEFETFMTFVQSHRGNQKFGFYVAEPPYLTGSAAQCRGSLAQQAQLPAAAEQRVVGRTGLSMAVQRIASAKQSAPARTRVSLDAPERELTAKRPSVSAAMTLASRLLGGPSK